MSDMYELRLPTGGDMVKIAGLKVSSLNGCESSNLPSQFFDLSTDYVKGDSLLEIMDNGVALDFVCENSSEIEELEAFIDHLQKGDQQKGKAAEIIELPSRDYQLYLVPQKPQHSDGTLIIKLYLMNVPGGGGKKRSYDDHHEREDERTSNDKNSTQDEPIGFPVYVNGISEGYEKEVESLLDEYGELISFEIPRSVREKCAKGEYRMLYAIGTFRNERHAEEAIKGLTGKVIGPSGTFRRLRLKWDRPSGEGEGNNFYGGVPSDNRWGGGGKGGYGKGYDDYGKGKGGYGKGYDDYRGGGKGKGGYGKGGYDNRYDNRGGGKGGYDHYYSGGGGGDRYGDRSRDFDHGSYHRSRSRSRSRSPRRHDDDISPPPKRSRPWDNHNDSGDENDHHRNKYHSDVDDKSDDEHEDRGRRRNFSRRQDDDKSDDGDKDDGSRSKRNHSPEGGGRLSDKRLDDQSIFVRNIDFNLRENEISKHFENAIGPVKSIELVRDHTGHSRGFGFIEFINMDLKNEALKKMPGTVMEGRSLIVLPVEPQARKAYHERQDYGKGKGGKGGFDGNRDVYYGGNDYGGGYDHYGKGKGGYGKGYDDYRGGGKGKGGYGKGGYDNRYDNRGGGKGYY